MESSGERPAAPSQQPVPWGYAVASQGRYACLSGVSRTIIHVDMDCFYAAIEMRDNPMLRGQPVAVGGSRRGVLTTCNYEARKFGLHSAMPTFLARRKCPHLVLVPVRFEVYRRESRRIRALMAEITDQIEPLSLDEAYLDVTAHPSPPGRSPRDCGAASIARPA